MPIIANSSFENMIKGIRSTIIKILDIESTRVINAVSARGPELAKIISDTESTSYNLGDVFIVFEFKESDESEYWLMQESNEITSYITSYDFKLKIYGNKSHDAARLIIRGFKNPDNLYELYDKGIKVEGLTKPSTSHEIINNTIWPRIDMDINLTSRIEDFDSNETIYFTNEATIITREK